MNNKYLKNIPAFGFKVMDMEDKTYELRRNVIDIIYMAKRLKNVVLPRIDVRIVDGATGCCGYAYMGRNIVHISKKYAKSPKHILTHVVLHEILHAVKSIEHDNKCYLMQPYLPSIFDVNKSIKTFESYFNNDKQ